MCRQIIRIELRPRRKLNGCVRSAVCKWPWKAPVTAPQLPSYGTLEPDGLWTRTRRGRTELKAIRNAPAGVALGAFGTWAEVIDRAWQLGARLCDAVSCRPVGCI